MSSSLMCSKYLWGISSTMSLKSLWFEIVTFSALTGLPKKFFFSSETANTFVVLVGDVTETFRIFSVIDFISLSVVLGFRIA